MNPLHALFLANDHLAELRRQADRERLAAPRRPVPHVPDPSASPKRERGRLPALPARPSTG